MTNHEHALQHVYQETDIFGLGDEVAGTQVWGVDMQAHSAGYTLVTSVAARDRSRSYGSLTVAVKADEGVFGKEAPRAVEISPGGSIGAVALQVDSDEISADGTRKAKLRTYKPPKQEGLFLPGDDEFPVFEKLHEHMTPIGDSASSIANMLDIDAVATLEMSRLHNSVSLNDDDSRRFYCMDYFAFGTSRTSQDYSHILELRMVTEGPPQSKRPETILYTSGDLYKLDRPGAYWREGPMIGVLGKPSRNLDLEELVAFSALGAQIQGLALNNPYI